MDDLRLFCDVARLASVSLAAQEHDITQSAASQRLGQLERQLGVKLLDRSVRPLRLTTAGEVFLRGCLDILDGYERLERKVAQLRELDGDVRVGAIYSSGIDLLSDVKERFEEVHPGVSVTVDYKHPDEVYDEVRQGRCDLGIVSYPQRLRNVGVIALRDERMAVVCRPGHALTLDGAEAVVHASQLAEWPMVMFESELPVARHIRKYLKEHGVTPIVESVFDNIDTIKNAVAVTEAVSILPARTVMREVLAESLAMVRLEPPLNRPLGVIHARRTGNAPSFSPAVQGFVDFLVEHAGPKVDGVANLMKTDTKPTASLAAAARS